MLTHPTQVIMVEKVQTPHANSSVLSPRVREVELLPHTDIPVGPATAPARPGASSRVFTFPSISNGDPAHQRSASSTLALKSPATTAMTPEETLQVGGRPDTHRGVRRLRGLRPLDEGPLTMGHVPEDPYPCI